MDNRTIEEIRKNETLLIEEIKGLIEENQELKKQLEKKYEKVGTLTGELLYEENTKLVNQQKEFIDWLEYELRTSYSESLEYYFSKVLSKYKEIVGVKDE